MKNISPNKDEFNKSLDLLNKKLESLRKSFENQQYRKVDQPMNIQFNDK